MSARTLGDLLHISRDSAARALKELATHGFLDITQASSFSQKRMAATYRMTHLKCDRTGAPASNSFMRGKGTAPDSRTTGTVSQLRPRSDSRITGPP
jgi:DNA-binding transcriptional MocR family regulator